MSKEQIQALAEIVGMEPADLWLIAQQARNPFRVSANALLSALLAAFVSAMLAGTPLDARADQHGKPSSQTTGNGLFIVTHYNALHTMVQAGQAPGVTGTHMTRSVPFLACQGQDMLGRA